jgi:hypothetical protein
MMGMKKLKNPDMAGGKTPETTANEVGVALAHDWMKGRKNWGCVGWRGQMYE